MARTCCKVALLRRLLSTATFVLCHSTTQGGTPYVCIRGGPCQYLGSEILQKQSYLGSVKNSFKKLNIWGLRILNIDICL